MARPLFAKLPPFSRVPRCSSITSRKRGVELAGHLRAFLPETTIIMMMSGHIEGLSEKILETIGITVFVNKPLPLRALREAVLKLVRSTPVDKMVWCQQKARLSARFGGTHH
jgi:hypothetical protein